VRRPGVGAWRPGRRGQLGAAGVDLRGGGWEAAWHGRRPAWSSAAQRRDCQTGEAAAQSSGSGRECEGEGE
jgi:hypothetical protein